MFPKNEIGLKKWLQCNNCERLRSLSFQKLRKQCVCRNHFEKRFFSTTRDRVRFCPDAYPTVFTARSREIFSRIPQSDALIPDNSGTYTLEHYHLVNLCFLYDLQKYPYSSHYMQIWSLFWHLKVQNLISVDTSFSTRSMPSVIYHDFKGLIIRLLIV